MADSRDRCEQLYEPIDEIESMVRAARDYVQASEDLRPRVLETARSQCGQRCIRQLAVFLVLLATFTVAGSNRLDRPGTFQQGGVFSGDGGIFTRAETRVAQGGDVVWGMVEAFTDLRQRQAEVLTL